jgi:hypothetical protein
MLSEKSAIWFVVSIVFFILLTPGVLVTIPSWTLTGITFGPAFSNGAVPWIPVVVHALLFAVLMQIISKFIKDEKRKAKETGKSLLSVLKATASKTVKDVGNAVSNVAKKV